MSPSRKSDSSSQLGLFSEPSRSANVARPRFELNERQRLAVEHVLGPMLVVAGAGTGKTTVLTQRIASLIRNGHARPEEILAITYTENAAAELVERVGKELGSKSSKGLRPATFHAHCFEILQKHGKAFGLLEPEDLWIYLRQRLPELKLEYYTRAASPAQFLNALLDFFDNCHDELRTAADYERYVEEVAQKNHPLPRVTRSKDAEDLARDEVIARCREIARVFRTVETMLQAEGFGTFAHMILGAMDLLRSDKAALEKARAGARFILVDEFQDCNIAQIELMQLLAGDTRNIFAVGDPDQAIYRFRGASSAAFEEFIQRFPDTKAVVLDRNQRSTAAILNCAFGVISHNPSVACALGKSNGEFERTRLTSDRERRAKAEGLRLSSEIVDVVPVAGAEQEAEFIANSIEQRRGAAFDKLPSCAVLYRSHTHREALVKEFTRRGIPFRVEGLNALESAESRDLLACLRVLHKSENDSLFRVAAMEFFKLDGVVVREAMAASREVDMSSVLRRVSGGDIVLNTIEDVRRECAAAGWKTTDMVDIVIRRFGFERFAPPVVAFQQFVAKWDVKPITQTHAVNEFLEYMKYFKQAGGTIPFPQVDADPRERPVQLMTVHAAKGLEFDHVYVIRATGGSFPTRFKEKLFEMPGPLRDPRCLAPADGPDLHLQEERRLFYVAMTRARNSLNIHFRSMKKDGSPSGFVADLISSPTGQGSWRQAKPQPGVELAAAAETLSATGLGAWLLLPPSPRIARPLSASAIDDYQNCPLMFKIRRDWFIPGDVSGSLHYGAAVHQALKDFYDAAMQKRPRTREQLIQLFEQELLDRHFDDEVQKDLYRDQGRQQLSEFYEATLKAPEPEVISTERTFELKINGALIRGRVDRIDRIAGDRVSVVDYKTGSAKEEKDAQKSLQLSIYALAARELWHMLPERLAFYNLETNEEVESARSDRQLSKAKENIAEVAENIAAGCFDPSPGFHCRTCRYRAICPATVEQWRAPAKRAAEA